VLLAILLMIVAPVTSAQVTNLTIQGSTSSFTFVSGGNLSWAYDVPNGDTTTCEIWIDVNKNSVIEPGTDRLYMSFLQADGVMDGLNGPPDIDGSKNGHVVFQSPVGIAPETYIMKFTDNGTGMQLPGTCTPLASAAFTISGKVVMPNGQSAQYILLELSKQGGGTFWHALTNANGDYVINMDSDTSGGQWRVRISTNPVQGGVISPVEYLVYPGLNPSGRDFTIQAPAAKIAGVVVDERGSVLPDFQVYLLRDDMGVNRNTSTYLDGSYQIGALGTELNGQGWFIQAGNGNDMSNSAMTAQSRLPALHGTDSLYRRLVIYSANSSIQGQVRVNGSSPGMMMQIVASNADTAQNSAQIDPGTGNFSIPVSDKIHSFEIFPINLGPNYSNQPVIAHPGDTGIQVNLTLTSIAEPASGVPQRFNLEQNYPNPFNPTTGIRYQVSGISTVELEVYNLLGQKVATLVNEVKQPGIYTVQFDASRIPSGVYFYRMKAGSFTSTRSMIVLK
jgi:hypothetical protein